MGLLPVAAALGEIALGVMDTGEAVVGTCLPVLVADLAGQPEGDGVLGAGLAGAASGE